MSHQDQKLASRLALAVSLLAFCVFPLASDFTYSHITMAKWVAAVIFALLCSFCFIPGITSAIGTQRLKKRLRSPELMLASGYLLWVGLSALFGTHAGENNVNGDLTVLWGYKRYEGSLSALCYVVIFYAAALYPARSRIPFYAAGSSMLVFCAIVAMQYAGMNPLGFYPEGRSIFTNYEFQGTLGNIDMVVGYAALILPVLTLPWLLKGESRLLPVYLVGLLGTVMTLLTDVQCGYLMFGALALYVVWLCLTQPGIRVRALVFLASLCGCLAVRIGLRLPWLDRTVKAVTCVFSSGVWVCAAAGVLLSAAAFCLLRAAARHPLLNKAMPRRAALLAIALLCLAAVLAAVFVPVPKSAGGLWEVHETLNGRGQDSFGSERLGVWKYSLQMSFASLRSAVFGSGPDTFYLSFQSYLNRAGVTLQQKFDTPHNVFIACLTNTGLPSMLLFIALLAVLGWRCMRSGTRGLILFGSLLCWAVQGLFTFSMCIVSPMAWALFGVIAALGVPSSFADETGGQPQ